MNYEFHTDADPRDVDAFVISSEQNTLYQTSPWAKVKNNWKSVFTSVTENGRIVGTALVLFRTLYPGRTLAYIPRGPVMDYHNAQLTAFYLENLRLLAKKHHAVALRFDPALLVRKYPWAERNTPGDLQNMDVLNTLKQLGAVHKGFTRRIEDSTQPRFSASVDLTNGYRDRLIKNTRQSIRTAEKRGVEVKRGHEYLPEFEEAMEYTEARQGIALRTLDYFRNMAEAFGDHCIIAVGVLNFAHQEEKLKADLDEANRLLETAKTKKEKRALQQRITNDEKDLARNEADWKEEGKDEVVLCGKLVCFNEKRMEFFYMGNNTKYMRVRANYYLYAKFLDYCVEHNIPYCSFGGIQGTLDDGLTEFKSAWPVDIEETIGEFNIILDPAGYRLFDEIYPKVLQTAAKLRTRKLSEEKK